MSLRFFAVLALCLATAPALAEDCSRITDKTARLECYDRSAAAPAPAPARAAERQTTSRRCQGITKKGAQCKRNAKPGSSYCWQHGG